MEYLIPAAGIALGLVVVRKVIEYRWGYCNSDKRMDGKIVIITGGNSGIGKETAKDLAKRGATIILACRDQIRADQAMAEIRSFAPGAQIFFAKLDLDSLQSVKECSENILKNFAPKIDVLINNAGVYYPSEEKHFTQDGFEKHYGVNHLGHFLLTHKLLDRIKSTDNSRIVIVSSMLYRKGELFTGNQKYPYSNSKLANLLHGVSLRKELKGTSVGVYTVSPGFVKTGLARHAQKNIGLLKKICFLPVAFLFMRNVRQGAQTVIHCSLTDSQAGFYRDCQPAELLPKALDENHADKLNADSLEQVEAYL